MIQSRDRYAQRFLARNENYTIKEAYDTALAAQLTEAGVKVAMVGGGLVLAGVVRALVTGFKHGARLEKEEE